MASLELGGAGPVNAAPRVPLAPDSKAEGRGDKADRLPAEPAADRATADPALPERTENAALARMPGSPPPVAVPPVPATPAALAQALAGGVPNAPFPEPANLRGEGRPAPAGRTLVLELRPEALGRVVARLRLEDGKLAVEIAVTTADARDRLGGDGGGEIARALEALGLGVERVTVSLSELPAPRTDLSRSPDPPAHGWKAGGEGGEPAGRGGAGRENRASQGDSGAGPRDATRSEPTPAGALYI